MLGIRIRLVTAESAGKQLERFIRRATDPGPHLRKLGARVVAGEKRSIREKRSPDGRAFKPLIYRDRWRGWRPPYDMQGRPHNPAHTPLYDRGEGYRTLDFEFISANEVLAGTPLAYMAAQNNGFMGVLPPEYEDGGHLRQIGPRKFLDIWPADRSVMAKDVRDRIETVQAYVYAEG